MPSHPREEPAGTAPTAVPASARVVAVAATAGHRFSKQTLPAVRLLEGLGVEGDGHLGTTVQHRSRVRRDPTAPNLRQVHLLASELLDELSAVGHEVRPGDLGENVTTSGVDLLVLPTGTVLRLGDQAEVEVTGLRNPCTQIDRFQDGLMGRVVGRAEDGSVVRRAGVMAVVRRSGEVRADDPISVVLPALPHRPLEAV